MDANVGTETIEGGALLAVLARATHADLREIAESINKGWDVFITWDKRFSANVTDLTKIPDVIAEYLLRAGGHSASNWRRGGGPEYREVLRDVCGALKAEIAPDEADIIKMEVAYLNALMTKALKGLTDAQKKDLLDQMKAKAGRPVAFDDLLKGSAVLGMLMPLIFMAVAQQTLAKGLAAGASVVLGRLAAGIAGPIGLVAGTVWLAVDMAGPSYRATIPAVAQVALLRQRMLYE